MSRRREQVVPISDSFREAFDAYRTANQEYFLNKNGRFRPRPPGLTGLGTSGDDHYQNESQALLGIERAYHFDRNDPIVGQAIDRLCDHILPEDFSLAPNTGDRGLDQALIDRWNDWSYDPAQCDAESQEVYPALERLALRGMFVGGDTFSIPLANGSLQVHEAHRCRTPTNSNRTILRGVEVDELNRRTGFYFTKKTLSPLSRLEKVGDTQRIAASDDQGEPNVFQLYNRRRFMLRGVSAFASSVDMIGMHGDLQFAALVKAQVASCFSIIEEVAAGIAAPSLPDAGAKTGSAKEVLNDDGSYRTEQQLYPGMRYRTQPGVKLTGFTPNVPNAEFFPHVKLVLAIIAANLGLPPFMLLLDAGDVGNYSAGRQTVEQARVTFRRLQKLVVEHLRSRVYRWKLRQWGTEDPSLQARIVADWRSVSRHEFKPPAWRYIDPTKDSRADSERADNLLDARSDLAGERGKDFEAHANRCLDDNLFLLRGAHERAQKLREAFPDSDVTFRDVLRLPKAASVSVTADPPTPDSEGGNHVARNDY